MRISDWSSDVCSSDLYMEYFTILLQRIKDNTPCGRIPIISFNGTSDRVAICKCSDAYPCIFIPTDILNSQFSARRESKRCSICLLYTSVMKLIAYIIRQIHLQIIIIIMHQFYNCILDLLYQACSSITVSYTHLDVYKRQISLQPLTVEVYLALVKNGQSK